MSDVVIITEANCQVASGHLYESIVLANQLINMGIAAEILYNSTILPQWRGILNNIPGNEYQETINESIDEVVKFIQQSHCKCVVTNLREVKDTQISKIKESYDGKIICIDEWGKRPLHCDIVINNMLNSAYWDYKGSVEKKYCGVKYLSLPEKLVGYHAKKKVIRPEIKNIVVSMGGVDKYNHTSEIVDYILDNMKFAHLDIILGGGYTQKESLEKRLESESCISIHQNVDYIYDLFYEADLAFSAGGNTMYELAAIGTPTIIYPTMEHERENAEAFMQMGFGSVILKCDDIKMKDISYRNRKKFMLAGKSLVDGKGINRITKVVMECLSDRTSQI